MSGRAEEEGKRQATRGMGRWQVGQDCQRERALAEAAEEGADVWVRGASGEGTSARVDVAGDALGRAGCGPRACAVREKVGPSGNGGTRVERPRREEAREQAGLGRAGRELVGPRRKRVGLGFGSLGRVDFLFIWVFLFSISNSNIV